MWTKLLEQLNAHKWPKDIDLRTVYLCNAVPVLIVQNATKTYAQSASKAILKTAKNVSLVKDRCPTATSALPKTLVAVVTTKLQV